MISIILPTLWKLNFSNELIHLQNSDVVGEIILINNDRKNTPDWFSNINLSKLIEVKPDSNTYCNPAWNMGIRLARFENSVLFSDDVIVDSYNFLKNIDEFLQNKNCLIGCAENCYQTEITNEISFIKETSVRPFGYGCIMGLRTKSYKPIPENFKIWHGDNFLFEFFKNKKDGSYTVNNLGMKMTKFGVSSLHHVDVCYNDDRQDFNNVINEYLKDYDNV